ncbi:cobalamin B12-binding domain-containing protein [Erythrobacter rubeus]|uniref:Cobalamin B12-binding domain-containing protein n=1 Tax=Erythrobacter rubeus TaxID=2760803 RepID=A0ABR8KL96_9SPHN|nr:B12-binding domain-containing protein [Erythrobacter rubeus]MBD2841105.1 cobalamin B12-binding domain-containing protein [Erythrobacter rubeus]
MANTKGNGVFEAGQAALRRVMSNPLGLRKDAETDQEERDARLSDDSINAIIEGEIIPRLLMAHASGKSTGRSGHEIGIASSDARDFAKLPISLEAANLLAEVDRFLEDGVSVETIYLDLLAPAARKLGEMWENDECDFVDVTMGLWRLQEVMRDLASRVPAAPVEDKANQRRALFSAMPGDQHSFGALMIDEVFSRAGWHSEALPNGERRELLDRLANNHFDVAGLTVSRHCPSATITNLITAMRSVSANPDISVLIGGKMINEDQSIVAKVGADGTGADARDALEEADRLVRSKPARAQAMR